MREWGSDSDCMQEKMNSENSTLRTDHDTSHLPPQSPTMLTIFKTNAQVQIDFHTRAQSTFLLDQAVMTCFEGQGLSPGNDQLALRTLILCHSSDNLSSSTG